MGSSILQHLSSSKVVEFAEPKLKEIPSRILAL